MNEKQRDSPESESKPIMVRFFLTPEKWLVLRRLALQENLGTGQMAAKLVEKALEESLNAVR